MIIKKALLTDPATQTSRKCDIRITNGLISAIGESISPASSEVVISAEGLGAGPRLIETH